MIAMKRYSYLLLFVITLFATNHVSAQESKIPLPKNLKQAVAYLNADCPDSLKTLIKMTKDQDLKKLVYPWGGQYKMIFNWNSSESNPQLIRHLENKGIINYIETVILVAFKQSLLGQKPNEAKILKTYLELERQQQKLEAVRATTDTINGIYIPKDLKDCLAQINKFWSDSTKNQVKQWTENKFTAETHLGFGMWMRNNWQLWRGSRLTAYFNTIGVYHAESISDIILTSYHRKLTGKEIGLETQVKAEKDHWEKAKQDEQVRKTKKYDLFKAGDTVLFKYPFGYSTETQGELFETDSCLVKGLVIDKNEKEFFIKIKVLQSCDPKGIIYSDNKNTQYYNAKTKEWQKPRKRVIRLIKTGKTYWSNYDHWESLKE